MLSENPRALARGASMNEFLFCFIKCDSKTPYFSWGIQNRISNKARAEPSGHNVSSCRMRVPKIPSYYMGSVNSASVP